MTTVEENYALAGLPVHEPPRQLFRFLDAPGGLSSLMNGTLKITPPNEFNDPFEFLPGFSTDSLSTAEIAASLLAPQSLGRLILQLKWRQSGTWDPNDPGTRTALHEWLNANPDMAAKLLESMRDQATEEMSNAFGVACFAAFSDADLTGKIAIRHWAIYGSGHRGIAIEYDGHHKLFRAWSDCEWLFPIDYRPRRNVIGFKSFEQWSSNNGPLWYLRRIAEPKCDHVWEDEKEWRLICPLTPQPNVPVTRELRGDRLLHLIHLWDPIDTRPNPIVRRVILGSRASKETEETVSKLRYDPRFASIRWARARLHDQDYSLVIEPLE